MGVGIGSIANTGLQAAMTNMATISNNISNANTVGFKRSLVHFSDIYPGGYASNSAVAGYGVQVQSVNQDFSLGKLSLTQRGLDIGLTNSGFFIQKNATTGETTYTRAGNLEMDVNGYFLGPLGRIQGFPAVNGQIMPSGNLVDLQVSTASVPAKPTNTTDIAINLTSTSTAPVNAFDITDPTSYNYQSNTTIYDSLGNSSDMSVYYIMTSPNNWTSEVYVNNQSIGSGTIVFDGNGALSSTAGLTNLSWTPSSGATSPQTLNLNFATSTQYSNPNKIIKNTQDGYQAGVPNGFSIDGDGKINVAYSNGQTQLQGQIAVAMFPATQGLSQTDNMSWLATLESGAAIIDPSASIGAINAGMLELSNVDLTTELIDLMGAQHDFQANAQVEQTYNQILQTIENLR